MLPTPHLSKLEACLNNPRLPESDRERLREARSKYDEWIRQMESVQPGNPESVEQLVGFTNTYKRFIELDLIFDSPGNFLYRQKGQLKLDNTILEEFLPQLLYRSLRGIDDSYSFGPHYSNYKARELRLFDKIKSLGYDKAMELVPDVNLDMLDYGNEKGIYNELQVVAYSICWKCWGRFTDVKLKFRSKPFGDSGMRVLDILQID